MPEDNRKRKVEIIKMAIKAEVKAKKTPVDTKMEVRTPNPTSTVPYLIASIDAAAPATAKYCHVAAR